MSAPSEPCGARMVTRWFEGMEQEVRWCDRTDGPCPFTGAVAAKDSDRRCGALPGQRLYVQWAGNKVDDSLAALIAYRQSGANLDPESDAVAVAIDALRECGAEVPS